MIQTVRYAALQCDKKGNPQLKAPLKGNCSLFRPIREVRGPAYDCLYIFYGAFPRAPPYTALHTVPGSLALQVNQNYWTWLLNKDERNNGQDVKNSKTRENCPLKPSIASLARSPAPGAHPYIGTIAHMPGICSLTPSPASFIDTPHNHGNGPQAPLTSPRSEPCHLHFDVDTKE
jgi:hypothetical protein